MRTPELRTSLRLILSLGLLASASVQAQSCQWWQTDEWCNGPTFPDPNFPDNSGGGDPSDYGSMWYVPDAPGNPYPASCGSSVEQRTLHAQFDIAAQLALPNTPQPSYLDSFLVTYDDNLKQTYDSDVGLKGGGWIYSTPYYKPDVCDP